MLASLLAPSIILEMNRYDSSNKFFSPITFVLRLNEVHNCKYCC